MRFLILSIAASMLTACVSAPYELYGIHQAKPESAAKVTAQAPGRRD